MKQNNIPSWIASGVTTLIGATSVEEVARVALLIIGILSGLFSLAYNIYCWYKKANADGKITKEELQEGAQIIKDAGDELKDKIKEDK